MSGRPPIGVQRIAVVAKLKRPAPLNLAAPANRDQRRTLQRYQQRIARAATQR